MEKELTEFGIENPLTDSQIIKLRKHTFITKDSGKRQEFSTGMKRDVQDGKPRYDLISGLGQKDTLLKRWAELMARGSIKYGDRNWEKACTLEELERFHASAWRHFVQAMSGETDEDHFAAVCFNLNGMLYVVEKLNEKNVG
jgi:hypothetical protein